MRRGVLKLCVNPYDRAGSNEFWERVSWRAATVSVMSMGFVNALALEVVFQCVAMRVAWLVVFGKCAL